MTNLILDIGNTTAKLAIFQAGKVVEQFLGSNDDTRELDMVLSKYEVDRIMVSSVAASDSVLSERLEEGKWPVTYLTHETPLPIKNGYGSPKTLGSDRLAAVVGAWKLFPGRNVLVVDAGTCITYDFIDAGGTYRGGNIAPGMNMRYKAMNAYTGRLPLLEDVGMWPEKLGTTTEEAMRGGVGWGIKAEMEYYATWLRTRFPKNGLIVLTGGDAVTLKEHVGLEPVEIVEMLVLIGLNGILEYNESK